MIRDHMKIWLLRPGFTLEQFGKLPEWLDATDERPGAEQLGARCSQSRDCGGWKARRCTATARRTNCSARSICRCELMMLFEDNLVAFVQSDRSLAVARLDFEADALPPTGRSTA